MNTVKIGLVSFAHVHAASYAALLRDWPGVELLCTDPVDGEVPKDEVRGRALAGELDVPYCDTYQDLLDWEPDAVIVCTENANHLEPVLRAAAAGCHVLCEKPLATTVQDAEAMVEACQKAGTFLMVAYPVRFSPQFARLQEAVRSGALGSLMTAVGANNGKIPVGDRAWFTQPALSGGGALVDHVVHVADLLDALLAGTKAERVSATTNQILHADKPQVQAETGGIVTLNYPGGFTAAIDCSWSQPDNAPTWGGLSLRVFGSKGSACIAPFAMRVDGFSDSAPGPIWLPVGENLDQVMLAAFIEGVRGGTAPQPDGSVGVRTLKIVDAARKSALTGAAISVD